MHGSDLVEKIIIEIQTKKKMKFPQSKDLPLEISKMVQMSPKTDCWLAECFVVTFIE